jgi:Protein of unknown function (DUF4238)
MYLRNFADADGMIGMRLADDPDSEQVISIDVAAIRKHYYRRTRLDGTSIDDVEYSLSVLEARAAPILRGVEENWPLGFEEKRILGELFAVQLLRGVRWRQGYETRTDRLVEQYRSQGLFDEDVANGDLTVEEVAERHREWFRSDTFRLRRMLYASPKGSAYNGRAPAPPFEPTYQMSGMPSSLVSKTPVPLGSRLPLVESACCASGYCCADLTLLGGSIKWAGS